MAFMIGSGNLLTQQVDALVNTVNTQGVMGKGIALQFKKAWPAMFDAYRRACARGEVREGTMHVWETGATIGPRFIINFPTKRHWRSPSRMEDIELGLVDLARVIRQEGITSIAVPPLGCGNGGLEWSDVEPRIRSRLAEVAHNTNVVLFPPHRTPVPEHQPVPGDVPNLTPTRAALLSLMQTYQELTLDPPNFIEIQKLTYFLQNSGERLHLVFEPHLYGPYANDLRKSLRDMEGYFIVGFGDGSTPVTRCEPVKVRKEILPQLDATLASNPATKAHLEATLRAVDGYESQFGLELLASVHWIMTHDSAARQSLDITYEAIRRWSNRKARLFSFDYVQLAYSTIHERHLVAAA